MNELQYFNGTSFSKTEKEYLCYQLGDCELQTAKKRFDMITELLASGVPHIALSVLSYLDAKDLVVAEQVSTTWRDIIRYSYDWKQLVESNVERNPLWKSVFSRRGWYKYLSKSVHIGRELYRQLYQCVSRDIHSLDLNWKKGHYTLTRINTGSTVTCLRFDTKKIVSGHGAEDYTIKIWDRSTLELTKVLRGHTGTVNCLEFNEQIIVSCSDDTTVRVWDIETGLLVNKLLHHQKWVFALRFTDKTLVTGSGDKTVAVWNFESPTAITLRTVLADHESSVYTVDLSESIIASGAGDGKIKVWDSYTGELIHSLHGHKKAVRCLLLQGSHIISGSFDRTIRMWSIDTGKCLQVFSGHQKWTMCVGYDGKRILSGSRDETIKIWNTVGGLMQNRSQCLATLKEHTGWVRALQFDDFHLMSCSSTTIHIYDFLGSNNNNFCLQTQTNIERALSSS